MEIRTGIRESALAWGSTWRRWFRGREALRLASELSACRQDVVRARARVVDLYDTIDALQRRVASEMLKSKELTKLLAGGMEVEIESPPQEPDAVAAP